MFSDKENLSTAAFAFKHFPNITLVRKVTFYGLFILISLSVTSFLEEGGGGEEGGELTSKIKATVISAIPAVFFARASKSLYLYKIETCYADGIKSKTLHTKIT